MDERAAAAKKRKREENGEASENDMTDTEQPKALQEHDHPKSKKRKVAEPANPVETEEETIRRRKEAKAAKKERKKEKKLKAKEKLDRQKARKQAEKASSTSDQAVKPNITKTQPQKAHATSAKAANDEESDSDDDDDDEMAEEIDIGQQPANAFTTQLDDSGSISVASEADIAEVFSPPQESGTSSISSIIPPNEEKPATAPITTETVADTNLPPPRERLANALAAFRTSRKADTNSAPKSRAELLQQRRRQEERRRAEKKEQKRREKEEAARQQEAEIAARFSPGGSGSLLNSPRSPISTPDTSEPNNFSFSRIAFEDGTSFSTDPSAQNPAKKTGPRDAATALAAAQHKQSRLATLPADKQARAQSQDMWNAARSRAAGEKVKDDTSLLKKALKRHEGQKRKSEKEWKDRKEGIEKSQDARQKKREGNLAKRKEEKGKGGGKKVRRPGFEGSFKGRTGKGKKGKA